MISPVLLVSSSVYHPGHKMPRISANTILPRKGQSPIIKNPKSLLRGDSTEQIKFQLYNYATIVTKVLPVPLSATV